MTVVSKGAGALDYKPCCYGNSRLLFRGPARPLSGEFLAAVGGTETYGRFVAEPYPALVETALGLPVVNFGCMNAGIDAFLNEPVVIEACRSAAATIVQAMGAQNMTNRYYAVHPRRNDRFIRASPLMKSMFPGVDFAEFSFTRHMLGELKARAPERFRLMEDELKAAWVARMRQFAGRIGRRSVLLWVGDYRDDPHGAAGGRDGLGPEPLMVDETMILAVAGHFDAVLRLTPSERARTAGTEGMVFSDLDLPAASEMPGPLVHAEIAADLLPVLRRMMEQKGRVT